jgi:hypothetical protein
MILMIGRIWLRLLLSDTRFNPMTYRKNGASPFA